MRSEPKAAWGSGLLRTRPAIETILRYALAVLSVTASIGVTLVLNNFHLPHPFSFYLLSAIAITFWYAGTGPGVVAVVLSSFAFGYFYAPAPSSGISHLPYLINYVVVALLISWVSASRRRAERLLSQARDELEVKVKERTADLRRVNAELHAENIERKRAEKALRASEQVARGQAEALIHSLDVLATAPAPEKFIGQMLSTIGRILNGQGASLWLLDESTDLLVLRATVEGSDRIAADPEHPFIQNASSWKEDLRLQEMFFMGAPVVCDDLENDPRVSDRIRDYLKSKGTQRFLTVPTLVGGQVRGFISIRHGDRPPYQPGEIELAQALAHQVMLAIQLTEFAEQGREAAVLDERNRMARDIHDTLAQGFTGVIVQMEAAEEAISSGDPEAVDQHLRRAADLARSSLSEARRSVRALRPHALEQTTFWDALKANIQNTTMGTPLHTEFQLRGKLRELPQILQENLLHIGQEALTNTLKHAHADRFEARLSFHSREVRLELHDNGNGFILDDPSDGFGLAGMRERVEQMGGILSVTSSHGKGTTIVVVSPYEQQVLS